MSDNIDDKERDDAERDNDSAPHDESSQEPTPQEQPTNSDNEADSSEEVRQDDVETEQLANEADETYESVELDDDENDEEDDEYDTGSELDDAQPEQADEPNVEEVEETEDTELADVDTSEELAKLEAFGQELDDMQATLDRIESEGIDLKPTFLWDLKPSDIKYLYNKFPYLQVVDTRVEVSPPPNPTFIKADPSGWTIFDYGNAMCASPGLLLWGGGDFSIETEGDPSTQVINAGKGTLVNQAYETAIEMIRIADERGWEGLLIVDGHPLMKWAAWVEAYDRGFVIEGYEPLDGDFERRHKLRRKKEEEEELRQKVQARLQSSRG